MVLYRKYRPQNFSELIGQDHIVNTLLDQLQSGRISHGYLFSGPKGTGKTSTARILAKAVNCQRKQLTKTGQRSNVHGQMSFSEPCNKCTSCLAITDGSHLDLIEIDAASNRNIDDIRDLKEKIKLSAVSSRYKVYIIDEVHMLHVFSFNALLKTLEEPPSHAIFILCTTEISKLPKTIISRVQKFAFRRASDETLKIAVEKIAKRENIIIDKDATEAIVKASDGSFRDAISLLDQLSTSGQKIGKHNVEILTVASDWERLYVFVEALAQGKAKDAIIIIEDICKAQADISFFLKEIILFLEKLLFIKIGFENEFLELEKDQINKLAELAKKFTFLQVQDLLKSFLISENDIRMYPLPQIPLVLAVCKYCMNSENNFYEGLQKEPSEIIDNFKKSNKKIELEEKNPVSSKQVQLGKQPHPKSSKKSSNTNLSIPKFEKHWKEYLDKIRSINSQVMAILRSANIVKFEGNVLTLMVYYKFHKDKLEEPKISTMLHGALEDIIGKSVRVVFVLSTKEDKLPKILQASDVIDVKQNDLETAAVEIFSK
ncbi:DNA polymerase III, subunit gamma and tau [Candidatus Curtissbacteria bacterium RIFCSPHIGHO2_12_FULL_38_9b]|uniref:DNA polymerase III subunit gamma/tau n=1 Tax=Candidatus Curtissbacteria bacterium RIFCSPHIGHO2_12_FULL_38_9b TaxID=1797720 RepID=A0A1F5GWF3_9BACT|nr:MAG: DNA polymerase III, subunit gamma and tau [Candidatus Curtissbacteria bacterium RIFCSPHIGHO2_12_FULL_38_9b]